MRRRLEAAGELKVRATETFNLKYLVLWFADTLEILEKSQREQSVHACIGPLLAPVSSLKKSCVYLSKFVRPVSL